MRKIVCLILFTLQFIAVNALAQIRDAATSPGPGFRYNKPFYIVDGEVNIDTVANIFEELDPAKVLEVEVLSGPIASAFYGTNGAYGGYSIVTKKYAKTQYQTWLGELSKAYQTYLVSHNNDDTAIEYFVDNRKLNKDFDREITELYHTPQIWISKVSFSQQRVAGHDSITLRITLKTKP